jgi:aldose 1-epimerase
MVEHHPRRQQHDVADGYHRRSQYSMNFIRTILILFATLAVFACSSEAPPEPRAADATESPSAEAAPAETEEEEIPVPVAGVDQRKFGETRDGQTITLYQLSNGTGMTVEIINYGGIVRALTAPSRDGVYEDVVLGYDNLAKYEADSAYFGALIGRYGNRIAAGKFELDGVEYTLAANNDPNHLHGGNRGFDKVVWEAFPDMGRRGPSLLLSYVSQDGEEGYPGKLRVRVKYTLTYTNELIIDYDARTDKATPVNLTNHSYFNLSGNAKRDILGHQLQIAADYFTPVDSTLIPTGEYRPVEGTPFDFRTAKVIGVDIDAEDEQIKFGGGYDHNWVIDQEADGTLRRVATLSDPESGRVMTVDSTEPGLQFYSGNFLDGSVKGKGVVYQHRYGLCLETQHFPDSPNQPAFPSTILQPGEKYESRTIYTFSAQE